MFLPCTMQKNVIYAVLALLQHKIHVHASSARRVQQQMHMAVYRVASALSSTSLIQEEQNVSVSFLFKNPASM